MTKRLKKQKLLKKSGIFRHFFPEKIYQIPNFPGFFSEKPETPIKITTEYSWNFVNILAKHFICPFKSDEFLNKVENFPKKMLKNSGIFSAVFSVHLLGIFGIFGISPLLLFQYTWSVFSFKSGKKIFIHFFRQTETNTRIFVLFWFCIGYFDENFHNARARQSARFASVVLFCFSAL